MAQLGWQDLDSIINGLKGAAVAASIAGASEAFDQTKGFLRDAAPIGKSRRTVHFANPKIGGGRIRQGGRTRQTINYAYPDIDVVSLGDGAHVTIDAMAVMAPQGVYQDGPAKRVAIRPVERKFLGWIVGGSRGRWSKGVVAVVGGRHKGWINRALTRNVQTSARASAAFARQFPGGRIAPHAALILDRPFIDTSGQGAWFGENTSRARQKDLALRRQWQAASSRSSGQWRRAYLAAIGRFS